MSEQPCFHRIAAVRTRLRERVGGRYTLALVSTVIALIAYPLAGDSEIFNLFIDLWVFLVLGFLIASLRSGNFSRLEVILLAGATLGMGLTNLVANRFGLDLSIAFLCLLPFSMLFFFHCAFLIVRSVFEEKQVTADMLCGAVLAYLLIGVAWICIYAFIDMTVVDAFSFGSDAPAGKGAAFVYFSFVTLTTLGYGDILPVAEIARTAAYLQAVTGVMFGAIFVAALVGNWKNPNAD